MKIPEARSSKNVFLHFSMFYFSLVRNSFLTPKELNQAAYIHNLSNFVILLQQRLGSFPRPGQLNTSSLVPMASYQAASP